MIVFVRLLVLDKMEVKTIQLKDGRSYTVRESRDRFFYPQEWKKFEDAIMVKDFTGKIFTRTALKQQFTFRVLINTGARINEARNIKVEDIDFDRCNIAIRVVKKIKNERPRPRHIPISTQFSRWLKSRIKYLELKPGDKIPVMSTSAGNIAMKNALQRAGIKDWQQFSIHNIRKTFETWLIALGVDSMKVIKHLGHTPTVAAKHYISPDIFTQRDRQEMRDLIGDLYQR